MKNRHPSPKTKINRALTEVLENAKPAASPTQTWDELEDYYQTLAHAMADLCVSVQESVKVMLTLQYGGDAELNTVVHTMMKDCSGQFTERLLALRAQHEGRKGRAVDGKELSTIIALAQDYHIFYNQFTTVTFPQVMIVTEHMDRAQLNYARLKKESEATDPSVVTDVDFKEAKPAEEAAVAQTTTEEKTE